MGYDEKQSPSIMRRSTMFVLLLSNLLLPEQVAAQRSVTPEIWLSNIRKIVSQHPLYGHNCCQLLQDHRGDTITVRSNPPALGYQIELHCRSETSRCTLNFAAGWPRGTKEITLQQLVQANEKTSFASVSIDDDGDPVMRMSVDIAASEPSQHLDAVVRIWTGQMLATACLLTVIPINLCK
jgi:Putative bacterial sensory transduction regulator